MFQYRFNLETEKLSILKKELSHRSPKELIEITLRIARLKKENKELLSYLLFDVDDQMYYAEKLKKEIDNLFEVISDTLHIKSLRKILKLINKYARFTGNDHGEVELLVYFIKKLLSFNERKMNSQAMQFLIFKVLKKLSVLIPKLDEDLQYDYSEEYNRQVEKIYSKMSFWNRFKYDIPKI